MSVEPPVTKVWQLAADGTCTGERSLGVRTGKVDFSPTDPDLITFSVMNHENQGGGYFTVPSSQVQAQALTLNLKTQKVRRISAHSTGNAVYPSWRADGTVIYLEHPLGAVDSSEGENNSSFVVVDPRGQVEADWLMISGQCLAGATEARYTAAVALGNLWSRICGRFGEEAGAHASAFRALDLDPVRCRNLVNRYWVSNRAVIAGSAELSTHNLVRASPTPGEAPGRSAPLSELTPADLLAACPSDTRRAQVPVEPRIVGDPGVLRPPGAAVSQPLPSTPRACISCHADVLSDRALLAKKRTTGGKLWIREALGQMASGKMPMGRLSVTDTIDFNSKRAEFERDLKGLAEGVP
jgi:hypothetical protein